MTLLSARKSNKQGEEQNEPPHAKLYTAAGVGIGFAGVILLDTFRSRPQARVSTVEEVMTSDNSHGVPISKIGGKLTGCSISIQMNPPTSYPTLSRLLPSEAPAVVVGCQSLLTGN